MRDKMSTAQQNQNSQLTWPNPPRVAISEAARTAIATFFDHWRRLPSEQNQFAPHLRTFLDHPNPALQPRVAIIDVVPPQNLKVRLFATDRESTLGLNMTGANALDVYPPSLRSKVWRGVFAVVSRPCGWLTERIITSASGATTSSLALTLPLATDQDAPQCSVNYTYLVDRIDLVGQTASVNWVSDGTWIDLGAGVPTG